MTFSVPSPSCRPLLDFAGLFLPRQHVRRGPRGGSHEKFHASPSKKQACFLEGPLSIQQERTRKLLRSPPLLLGRWCVELLMAPPPWSRLWGKGMKRSINQWAKLFYLQLELFCLQLSFFAYSPLRPLLDALCHCKHNSPNCK